MLTNEPWTTLLSLDQFQAQRQALQAQGPVLFYCWIAESKPGGTAISARRHFQLRSRKPQFNGKKSRYLWAAAVGEYQAVIARGKAIKQLNRKICCEQHSKEFSW